MAPPFIFVFTGCLSGRQRLKPPDRPNGNQSNAKNAHEDFCPHERKFLKLCPLVPTPSCARQPLVKAEKKWYSEQATAQDGFRRICVREVSTTSLRPVGVRILQGSWLFLIVLDSRYVYAWTLLILAYHLLGNLSNINTTCGNKCLQNSTKSGKLHSTGRPPGGQPSHPKGGEASDYIRVIDAPCQSLNASPSLFRKKKVTVQAQPAKRLLF